MSEIIKISDIEVKPGEKKFGYIDVWQKPEYPSSTVRLPVYIVKGIEDGPKLCLTAGIHGCEYAGIAAVIRVCRRTKPEELKGAILGVPIVNMPGFENRTPHANPIDNKNLSNIYPGNPDGSISQIIIHKLLNEIILKSNFWIDCHGGDVDERQIEAGYVYFPRVGNNKIDTMSETMARIYNFKHIVLAGNNSGLRYAAKGGVPSILGESGETGSLTERLEVDIAHHVQGITNVMKYLGMIEGKPKITIKQKFAETLFWARSKYGGLFYPKVKAGDTISKDQVLGEVFNLRGDCIGKIAAPCNGIVRIMYTWHLIRAGDVVMMGLTSLKPVAPFPETDQFYCAQAD